MFRLFRYLDIRNDLYPYLFYYACFCLFECFYRFRIYKLKHMWLEDVLRPCGLKKIAKRGPKWPNIGKACSPEEAPKRSVWEASKTRPARGHHGLIVGPTTARGGGGTAVRLWWHSRAPLAYSRFTFFLRQLFDFWWFLLFLFYKITIYLGPIPSYSSTTFIFSILH